MTTRNSETIVERRTELLKLEGDGFSRLDIEKTLSQKFQVTVRTVSRDFQLRKEWQPSISNHSDRTQAYFSILNRFEQIYKKASFTYLHSKNESVTISALKVMLDVLSRIKELANVTSEEAQGDISYSIQWRQRDIQESLRKQKNFNEWSKTNLTPEEQEKVRDVTRLLIRYELQTSKKGESIH